MWTQQGIARAFHCCVLGHLTPIIDRGAERTFDSSFTAIPRSLCAAALEIGSWFLTQVLCARGPTAQCWQS